MPQGSRRVVVTGVGAISAAGPTAPDLWRALLDRRVCLTALDRFEPGRPAVAGQILDYGGPAGVPSNFTARLGRAAQLALDAAIQAIADSRIRFDADNAFQVGAIVGTAHGAAAPGEPGWPLLSSGLAGATVGLNIAGPSYAVAADGASGLVAISQAAALIRAEVISVAVAGGAEAPLRPDVWGAYEAAGLLSRQAGADAQRPFDLLRDGMVLGEGAAMLLLEERELAEQRGARIYAELAGAAATSGPPGDGAPPTDVDIARRALGHALREANRSPQEVDLLFAAGGGTRRGDERETDVLERAFGQGILNTPVTAVSPALGYAAGASGALSAAAAAFALAEGMTPPHATYHDPDPECGLNVVQEAQRDRLYTAAVCAYGTMGQNAALLLTAQEAPPA